jgi:hypothetical protein
MSNTKISIFTTLFSRNLSILPMGAPGRSKRCVCSLLPFYTSSTIFTLFLGPPATALASPLQRGMWAFFSYHCMVLGGYEDSGPCRIMRGETHVVGDPPGGRYVGGKLLFVFTSLLPLPTDNNNNIWTHRCTLCTPIMHRRHANVPNHSDPPATHCRHPAHQTPQPTTQAQLRPV